MAKIKWSIEALSDISEIGLFIERDSSHFAKVIVNRLYDSVSRLIEFPLSGREVPELRTRSLRELGVQGYRIIYQLDRDWVQILAVVHGRQDLLKKLKRK